MSCAEPAPSSREALALGLLHGPAELLPVSSSAHTTLLPWIGRWPYSRLPGSSRKSFELALHAGAAAAVLLAGPGRVASAGPLAGRRGLRLAAVASLPAAVCGVALRGRIERRLSGPRAAALGLLAGSAAMLWADMHRAQAGRTLEDLGAGDALAIGLAQAAALAPGVSRSGATLAAARLRGFDGDDSATLSFAAGLPLLAGAGAFETLALARRRQLSTPLAIGALASFASTLLTVRATRGRIGAALPLTPFALYRAGLAALVLRRLRSAAGAQ